MKVTIHNSEKYDNFPALESYPEKSAYHPVVLIHGYGGCKEEMLPFAVRLGMAGFKCYIPDLPGHGENKNIFSLKEAGALIGKINSDFASKLEPAVVGHSIGVLLAFNTKASNIVAISPPAPQLTDFGGSRTQMLKTLRARKVVEETPYAGLREILKKMQYPSKKVNSLIVYAKNDLSSIIENACNLSKKYLCDLKKLPDVDHNDIINAAQTANLTIEFLNNLIKKAINE